MQKIAPYMVGEFIYQDSIGKQDNYLDYDPNALTYVLVNSVQELKAKNETLHSTVANLETRLAHLEQLLGKETIGSASAARLDQNQPNPYNKTTIIGYFVPESAQSAQLKVFTVRRQMKVDN